MVFPVGSALLDALVLSLAENDDTYGYKITQEIREAMEMSESTLYPVLRRLLKNGYLASYDREYMGRNRRYYSVTDTGKQKLSEYRNDWEDYKSTIEHIYFTGVVRLNKQQYLAELRTHLAGLPANEIDMAVKFYAEYFDEAGNDAAVAEELGKPFHLAKSIISEQSAYSRSVIYMQYKQNKTPESSPQQSIFSDIKQTAYKNDGEIYLNSPNSSGNPNIPNIKVSDGVNLNKPLTSGELELKERQSKRAFIIAMTAIICGTIICIAGIAYAAAAGFIF
jgi:PadR family transcriptional regulator PadR